MEKSKRKRANGGARTQPPARKQVQRKAPSPANIGSVVKIVEGKDFGFLQCKDSANVTKDIFFHFDRIASGTLSLMKGDIVEFSLSNKDRDSRPSVFWGKLITGKERNDSQLRVFLDSVKMMIKRAGLENSTSSEEIVKILGCEPAWRCVVQSLHSQESLLNFMELFKIMSDNLKSLESHFKSIVKIIAGSKLLDMKNSPLISFIEGNVHRFSRKMTSYSILHTFLLKIVANAPDKARNIVRIIEKFTENPNESVQLFYDLLEAITSNSSSSVGALYWHELPLVPTVEEIEGVLKGKASECLQLQPIKKKGPYQNPHEYFEILFRLLRADCFQSFKEGINNFLKGTLDKRDLNVYFDVRIVGLHISVRSRVCLAVELRTDDKKINWNKSTKLMFGNLFCISMNGQFNDVIWTTVASREHMQSRHIVLVEMCTELNSMPDVDCTQILMSSTCRGIAAESPTYYRAYGPILKALQRQDPTAVSFKEELVFIKQAGRPDFLMDSSRFKANVISKTKYTDDFELPVSSISHFGTIFDDSQKAAVTKCLKHRIGIIQGPPGTGKTFIGVKLVQLLLSLSTKPSGPILILSYKNHALDEFLKAIIDVGIDNVVRVGGNSKDGEINAFSLNNIERTIKKNPSLFQAIREIEDKLSEAESEVKMAFDKLKEAKTLSLDAFLSFVNDRQLHDFLIKCPWQKGNVASFLGEISQASYDELKQKAGRDPLLRDLIREALEIWKPSLKDMSNFARNLSSSFNWLSHDAAKQENDGDSTEEISSDDENDVRDMLIERQSAVSDGRMQFDRDNILMLEQDVSKKREIKLCEFAADFWATFPTQVFNNINSFWNVKSIDKPKLVQFIIQKKYDAAIEEFQEKLKDFEQLFSLLNELKNQHRADILKEKDVIAMTITGASLNYDILQAVKPGIVVVEEAAELLEAQLVPALGSWTKQLILIGDHKQLKPPVETHFLEQEFNMNLSLMERLIDNGFEYGTLNKQNRMRPEFANLLLDIYPDLQSNLDRVSQNEAAKCLLSSAYFWHHENKEVYDRSASNDEEANRAVNLAIFMIEQGIEPCKITILSAYKGQNSLIRKMLSAEGDQGRLKDLQEKDKKIVTQTIDNYQGDENDFVIISLVRSNEKETLGFLKLLNRRCVAQSRSRCGLYFIGNVRMFYQHPNWKNMLAKMLQNKQVTPSITLVCPKHPQSQKKASSSQDTNSNGLCKQLCNTELGCGHFCKKLCQPIHMHDGCSEKCMGLCHKCRSPCGKRCKPLHSHEACDTLIKKQLLCGHCVLAPCNSSFVLCDEIVKFFAAKCNHLLERKCYESEDDVKCEKACSKCYPCGHYCKRSCWEVCRQDCYECFKIQQIKEKQREEEEIKMREMLEIEERKRIKQLKEQISKELVREELFAEGDTADLYLTIKDQVMKFVQPFHNWFPVVTKIEKVTNNKLEMNWRQEKLLMYDPSMRTERKFHGTSKEAIDNIIKEGFKMPEKAGMYGKGIYFATDSSKSAQDIYTKGSGMLLLCDVLLGKTKTVEAARPDMTAQKLKAEQYDSLFAKRDTRNKGGVLYDEYVVYNCSQALPKFIIHYKKQNALSHIALPRSLVSLGTVTKHKLKESRSVDTTDPLDMHYRIAESQFRRLMNAAKCNRKIKSITFYSNPALEKKFNDKIAVLKKSGHNAECIFGFHGTSPANVDNIMQKNFRIDLIARNTGNPGQYGAGIYFSEIPSVCFHYGHSLLLCKVLLGNCYDVTNITNIKGKALTPGYDSHGAHPTRDGNFQIIVIFKNDQILPCYLIESEPIT